MLAEFDYDNKAKISHSIKAKPRWTMWILKQDITLVVLE
jgi:hypothetical protein